MIKQRTGSLRQLVDQAENSADQEGCDADNCQSSRENTAATSLGRDREGHKGGTKTKIDKNHKDSELNIAADSLVDGRLESKQKPVWNHTENRHLEKQAFTGSPTIDTNSDRMGMKNKDPRRNPGANLKNNKLEIKKEVSTKNEDFQRSSENYTFTDSPNINQIIDQIGSKREMDTKNENIRRNSEQGIVAASSRNGSQRKSCTKNEKIPLPLDPVITIAGVPSMPCPVLRPVKIETSPNHYNDSFLKMENTLEDVQPNLGLPKEYAKPAHCKPIAMVSPSLREVAGIRVKQGGDAIVKEGKKDGGKRQQKEVTTIYHLP